MTRAGEVVPYEPLPIAAVMVVHNEAHRLDPALRRLRQQVRELYVWDNGSTDDTVAIARRWADGVVACPYAGTAEAYYAAAVDAAATYHVPRPDWILVLDADEELVAPPDLLRQMLDQPVHAWGLLEETRFYFRDRYECPEVGVKFRLFRPGSVEIPTKPHTLWAPKPGVMWSATEFVAIMHEKSAWEQKLDVELYDRLGVLGPDAEKVMARWADA